METPRSRPATSALRTGSEGDCAATCIGGRGKLVPARNRIRWLQTGTIYLFGVIAMERWEFRALFATLVVYGLIVFATYQSAILPLLKR